MQSSKLFDRITELYAKLSDVTHSYWHVQSWRLSVVSYDLSVRMR